MAAVVPYVLILGGGYFVAKWMKKSGLFDKIDRYSVAADIYSKPQRPDSKKGDTEDEKEKETLLEEKEKEPHPDNAAAPAGETRNTKSTESAESTESLESRDHETREKEATATDAVVTTTTTTTNGSGASSAPAPPLTGSAALLAQIRNQKAAVGATKKAPETTTTISTETRETGTKAAAPLTGSAALLAQMRAGKNQSKKTTADVTFLYASQTGTAHEIAKMLHAEALARKLKAVVEPFDAIDVDTLSARTHPVIVFVASSTGDGEAPDNAQKFLLGVKKASHSATKLEGVRVCSLGLGDSNYTRFMAVPRQLKQRFAELGAQTFYQHVEADEVDGLEDTVDGWMDGLWDALAEIKRDLGGNHPPKATTSSPTVNATTTTTTVTTTSTTGTPPPTGDERNVAWRCPLTVPVEGPAAAPTAIPPLVLTTATATAPTGDHSTVFSSHVDPEGHYTAAQPWLARVVSTVPLTTPESETADPRDPRRVVHVTLDLAGSHITLHAGDSVGVVAPNRPAVVEAILTRLGLTDGKAEAVVGRSASPELVSDTGSTTTESALPCPPGTTVRGLFTHYLDVSSPPRKTLLAALAEASTDPVDAHTLRYLSSRGGRVAYKHQILEARASLLDLLRRFPSCQPGLDVLVHALPALTPRMYSAVNSGVDGTQTVSFALTVVKYATPYDASREGLASNWLDELSRSDAEVMRTTRARSHVPMFVKRGGAFAHPRDLAAPLLMIGPGTGVAPFRGFLYERAHRMQEEKAAAGGGEDVGASRLYFGCRSRGHDYLFGRDLEKFEEDGVLTKLRVAFSREQAGKKVYVQHLLREDAAEVKRLVQSEKAAIFVCGDGAGMAKDVHEALVEILGGGEEARATLTAMTKEGRYVRDIWCA